MNKRSIISNLQTIFGVTASELIFITLLIFGLMLGTIYKLFFYDTENKINNPSAIEVYRLLDSLAEVQKTTYIGTDIEGNPVPELEAGDTIVKDKPFYPETKKKEIPVEMIDLNNASLVELMKLPGVGESTARKIIEYREKQPFGKIDDIQKVKGIGQKKFDNLKNFIIIK